MPAANPYGAPLPLGGQPFGSRGASQAQQQGFQPAYDPAIYGSPSQAASGHPANAYHDDPGHAVQDDEAYDEDYADAPPRRFGLKLVVALAALAIIGTGGVLGYRALFKQSASGSPPVIKANTTPSKIAAAPASTKQINDRVGDTPQEERVVSREEKPVEVKDTSRATPRVSFPGLPASPGTQDAGAAAAASPPFPAGAPMPASNEPKKIRTVTIRPDQVGSSNNAAPAPAAPRQNQPPQNTASAAPVAAPAPQRAAAPAPSSNAPLSLSPQVASAEASARPAFPPPPAANPAPAAPPTRLAAAPPAADAPAPATGGYTVQISSQRSENEAHASFRSLQAKFPSLLGDRQPIIRRADLKDKGIYFRAMVGPFASVEQAAQFCGSLKSAGGQCVVQRN
jgi:hypothetical protein